MNQETEVLNMPMELSVFDPLDVKIAEAKTKNESLAFDYHDKQGNKDARSWITVLRRLKAPVNEMHKTGKSEALAYCAEWDKAKNKRIGAIEDMIDFHYEPIKAIEDAEAAKKAEEERIEQERMEAEEAARQTEMEATQQKLAEEQEELRQKQEAFDRKERETRIAEEAKAKAEQAAKQAVIDAENAKKAAEDKAKQDAVNAENARKQAIVDAENAKAAAIQKVKDDATAEAAALSAHLADLEAKEKVLAEEAEAKEQARISNQTHQSKVHMAIYRALIEQMKLDDLLSHMGPALSKLITQSLIDGKVPHVKIQY